MNIQINEWGLFFLLWLSHRILWLSRKFERLGLEPKNWKQILLLQIYLFSGRVSNYFLLNLQKKLIFTKFVNLKKINFSYFFNCVPQLRTWHLYDCTRHLINHKYTNEEIWLSKLGPNNFFSFLNIFINNLFHLTYTT